ncbi:MAG: glycosyltransferase family 4 protein [Desulfobacterales bacterium]|nr:glycosyltransferase family 4 protein [Desulfobacterales bacterium]MDX2512174.1 glycosyltransferase family 4 protein [Desulfobacterales bacterium]
MTMQPKKPVLGMILKGYPRISESFISNEILLLEQQGIPIHIFSMRQPRESFSHKSVQQINARVDYLPESILAALPQLLFYNLLLAIKAPGLYLRAIVVAFRRFLRTHKSATIKHLLQAGYLVQKLLPGSGVVHFHAHFAHSPSSVGMFVSWLSGLEFSFTGHAKDIYTSNPLQLKEKMTKARFVVTCTEYNRRHLSMLAGNDNVPLYRIYHGIDLDLFSGGDLRRHPTVPYHFVTVARLVPKKGLATVYRALQWLQKNDVDFQHTLIGDGDDRDKVLALIRDLGLSGSCKWVGTLAHEYVLDHYRRSDLFVLGCEQAANGDRDGIPNVFVESLAMGLPVVGTRLSAIPELIEDGKTGLLVQPGNDEEMARAMLRILADTQLREQLIHSGKERVRQAFNNRELIKDLFSVYRKEVPELKL